MSSRLSPVVRTLIRRHVRSVGELELLMLLHAERDRSWSVEDVCEELACPPTWAVVHLEAMARGGLLARDDGRWRFEPTTVEVGRATAELEEAYRLHSGDVVRFVFATPGRELREFSDAFRMRWKEG